MTRLTDGKRTIEITMNIWTGNGYTPDLSADFFDVGSLDYNDEINAYQVDDAYYCAEQALDWETNTGACIDHDADPEEVKNRTASVDYI